MPETQPITPSHRLQLRWAAGILVIQLLLQSYLLWSRLQSGFAGPSDEAFVVALAVGWGLCLGLLIHAVWRGPLSRLHTFALYAVPTLLLGLPAAMYVSSQGSTTADPEYVEFATRYVRFESRSWLFYPLSCSQVKALDIPDLNRIFAERTAEEVDCFGLNYDGALLAQTVPTLLADMGGQQVTVSDAVPHGSWLVSEATAEMPLYPSRPKPTVPARFVFAGLPLVNHTAPFSAAERALLNQDIASAVVIYGDVQALHERLTP
ncbi:hypothetical protein GCM10017783_03820 [Deinococcus piscis]|uniref:Uncharacterized protein n=1 Tax=Deinococcus piscis TaxID=394230 RepID=A0ABQ3JZM5_9DEIO|nr:hypothetical protein [Deinococcus piscis]GHF95159.1 hypothetical protein GCM10017783_03820 [Deinococcus piscis]